MDNNHRLGAPDNDSLQHIEQLDDHSELAGLYPDAHHDWEDEDLLSREAREEKRDREQLRIRLTIRGWFPIIGLLTPLPFILAALLSTTALTYIKVENLAPLMLPIVAVVLLWLYVSYRSMKQVYHIFYSHSLVASPFIAVLLALLIVSFQALFVTMTTLYTDSLIYNTLLLGALVLALSVIYSGVLMAIWVSQRMSGLVKVCCISALAVLVVVVTVYLNLG